MIKEYWEKRSKFYDKLCWVNDKDNLNAIIKACNFSRHDCVLDAGCGTGAVIKRIHNKVNMIFGLDISQDMLDKAPDYDNVIYKNDTIVNFQYHDIFSKIIMRMCLHHITDNPEGAIKNCYNLLSKNGSLIINESLAPAGCDDFFNTVFKLKENRIELYRDVIIGWLNNAGFKNTEVIDTTIKKFSIRNWITNNTLPEDVKKKIYDMHINAPDNVKKAYNMKITKNDCLVDVNNVCFVGRKDSW